MSAKSPCHSCNLWADSQFLGASASRLLASSDASLPLGHHASIFLYTNQEMCSNCGTCSILPWNFPRCFSSVLRMTRGARDGKPRGWSPTSARSQPQPTSHTTATQGSQECGQDSCCLLLLLVVAAASMLLYSSRKREALAKTTGHQTFLSFIPTSVLTTRSSGFLRALQSSPWGWDVLQAGMQYHWGQMVNKYWREQYLLLFLLIFFLQN